MSESQPRVQPGIPTGGQFAGIDRPAAAVSLLSWEQRRATIQTPVMTKVTTFTDELPTFPAELGEPTISFDYGDNGHLYATVAFGDGSVMFWSDYDEQCNSIVDGDEPTGLDDELNEQIIEYGKAILVRAEEVSSAAREAVVSAQKDALVAAVLGKSAAEVTTIASGVPDYDGTNGAERSAIQGEQAAALWGDADDEGTHVADTLANLLAYARKNDWDFDELLRRGRGYADDELNE